MSCQVAGRSRTEKWGVLHSAVDHAMLGRETSGVEAGPEACTVDRQPVQ